MLQVELDVLPQRAQFPAVEIDHLQQHANFAMLANPLLDERPEVLVVGLA